MVNLTYFAGFRCDYSKSELIGYYTAALAIVFVIGFLVSYYLISRVQNVPLRKALNIVLWIVGFVAWHIVYIMFVGLFGCPLFPLTYY